jgi:hypothetical protein
LLVEPVLVEPVLVEPVLVEPVVDWARLVHRRRDGGVVSRGVVVGRPLPRRILRRRR